MCALPSSSRTLISHPIQTLPSCYPPTFAAYQEYIVGLDTFVGIDELRAAPHFIRAAQLDTT